jgi:hypothetical protein
MKSKYRQEYEGVINEMEMGGESLSLYYHRNHPFYKIVPKLPRIEYLYRPISLELSLELSVYKVDSMLITAQFVDHPPVFCKYNLLPVPMESIILVEDYGVVFLEYVEFLELIDGVWRVEGSDLVSISSC